MFGGADTTLYGWMSLFFWKNPRDRRMGFIISPHETLTLRAEYHHFRLDKAHDAWYDAGKIQRWDKAGLSGLDLGQEVDLTVRKKVSKNLDILGGYCFFVPGRFIQRTGNSLTAQWFFLDTAVHFL
jgi:hypothetical protein